ncbi:MAG: DUF11 domain-containing protein, partial [Pseudomonadota bacterium]
NVTITDVNLGMIIDHNTRGQTAAALRHPDGTQVLLYFGTGGTFNDYNVLFDQSSGLEVDTGAQLSNNDVNAAPYQFTVRPSGANTLDDFNGRNAQGDWLFLACDTTAGTSGTYLRSEIFISGVQNFADLSLSLVPDNQSPTFGSNVALTLAVTHEAGDLTANGVTVDFDLPSGLAFQSATGTGTYNATTGTWSVGIVPSGTTSSITIVAEVLSSGSYSAVAEIAASSVTDPDSTPGNANANPSEDDTAGLSLSPGASGGTGPNGEPSLSCAAPEVFDWDSNPWPFISTQLSRSFPGGGSDGTNFGFAFTGDTNRRDLISGVNNAPETNAEISGGLLPAQQSLYYFQNLESSTESVDVTMDVGTAGLGVQDLQFSMFDIDFAAGQFRDRIEVTGSLGGVSVTPILTPASSTVVVGNVAVGTEGVPSTAATGNLIVTFLSPVDRVVVNYGNPEASTAVSNQAMAIHDLNYCPRAIDFGDSPASYGAPSHLVRSGFQIGATAPDGETGAAASAGSDGDDLAGVDDEDAIDFSALTAGFSSSIDVPVTGSGGFLQMWIDWNGDGDFSDTVDGQSEQVAADITITGTSGTATVPVTVPAGATLSQTVARLRWSSQSGLGITGQASDGEVEDHALIIGGAAALDAAKTNAVFDPGGLGLYALPGNDVIYTITVSNSGQGATDTDTVVLIDVIPDEVDFWNGDIDSGGPDTFTGTDPVGFTQANGAALTLTYGTDVAFSTGPDAPADFSECSAVAPDNTYRTDLEFICINPKGALGFGDPDPSFSVSFRARIR